MHSPYLGSPPPSGLEPRDTFHCPHIGCWKNSGARIEIREMRAAKKSEGRKRRTSLGQSISQQSLKSLALVSAEPRLEMQRARGRKAKANVKTTTKTAQKSIKIIFNYGPIKWKRLSTFILIHFFQSCFSFFEARFAVFLYLSCTCTQARTWISSFSRGGWRIAFAQFFCLVFIK